MPEIDMTDIKAPTDAFDANFEELILENVSNFDWSKPLSDQVVALVKAYLVGISLQWSLNGLNVYPLGEDSAGFGFHGWAFPCPWAIFREELYVFMSGNAHHHGSAYDEEALKEISKLRDEIASLVDILDREIAAGKPSPQTMRMLRT